MSINAHKIWLSPKLFSTLIMFTLLMQNITGVQAQPAPRPDPYGHVDFFVTPTGSNNDPYDACREYAGQIRYEIHDNPTLIFTVGNDPTQYSFSAEDLIPYAAATWVNALRSDTSQILGDLPCELSIRAVSFAETSNYRVEAISLNNHINALGVPARHLRPDLGINQAGIYFPAGRVIPIGERSIRSFEEGTSHQNIAQYMARHIVIHEMGHTLGLRHPDTTTHHGDQIEPRRRQARTYIDNNNAQSLPIMISQPSEYFRQSRDRGLINSNSTPQPNEAEVNAIRRVNVCGSTFKSNLRDNYVIPRECSFHITYSIFDYVDIF